MINVKVNLKAALDFDNGPSIYEEFEAASEEDLKKLFLSFSAITIENGKINKHGFPVGSYEYIENIDV